MTTTTITPRIGFERITINLKGDIKLPRGYRWQKTVTTLAGNKLKLKGTTCGLPNCYCDAEIVEVI